MRTLPLTNRGLHLPTIVTLGLLTLLAALLASASAVSAQSSAPVTPERPTGTVVFIGGVDLEWNDVPGADSYDVQLYRNGQWIDLPGDGVEIAFYGAGAIIRELDPTSSLWFQVRARNAHGISDWSDFHFMASTNQYESGRQARPDNVVASGAPVINGTPLVGETLSADTTGIVDANGLDRVEFRFQWVSNDGSADTDIAGATDSVYTLAANDEGMTISVRVAFTDRGGYAESLTAVGTEQVASSGQANPVPTPEPAPDLVVIGIDATDNIVTGGSFRVGVTVTNQGDAQSAATTLRWKQLLDGTTTELGTAAQRALTRPQGSFKSIRLTAPSTPGTSSYWACVDSVAGESDTTNNCSGKVTVTVTNNLATGAPTIGGTAQVSQTLTAGTSGISDTDGLTNVSYSYQWLADDTEIAGATSSTYTLQASDNGKAIKVRVTFTDEEGNGESLTSEVTATVEAAPNNPATGAPSISGTAQVGEPLTADVSGIADDDGLDNVSYSYKWVANDGITETEITGATGSTYVLAATDESKTIKVQVSFTDDAGNDETLTSTATEAVSFAVQQQVASNPATGGPTVIGTVQAGETLTVDTSAISDADGLVNATFVYQWISNDGTMDNDIADETSSTYIINPWYLGKYIKVRVSFTDDAGKEETLTSVATTAVEASPNEVPTGAPTISGMAEVGQSLSLFVDALSLGIWDGNGMTYADFSYQWIRSDGTTDSEIPDASDPSYTLTDADAGMIIKIRVSFTDDGANAEALTSSSTTAVAVRPDSSDLDAPTDLWVDWSQGEEKGLELEWTAPEGTVTGYQILRKEEPPLYRWWEPLPYGCTPLMEVHVNNTGNDATTYTDTDVLEGALYTYSVRTINTEGVGSRSSFSRYTVDWPSVLLESFGIPSIPQQTTSDEPFFTGLQYRPSGYWPSGVPGTPEWRPNNSRNLSSTQINGEVVLTWEAPQEEVTGYQILRRMPEQCEYGLRVYAEIADSTVTSWADSDVEAGTLYEYRIRAVNDVGAGRLEGDFTSIRPRREGGGVVFLPVEPNSPAQGVPIITGTAQVGETLTADGFVIADQDGLESAQFDYQWLSNDGTDDTEIAGATSHAYTLTPDDEGKTIKVRVSFADDKGYSESLTSTATASVVSASEGASGQGSTQNSPATGAPTISGTAQVGETLTADTSGIADSDGLASVSYSYQWIRNDGTSDTDITDATGSSYTLVAADEGNTTKVKVTFTDDADNDETLTSTATSSVAARPNSEAAGAPTISGTAQVGETLTADTSGIADSDGLASVSYSYQWIRNDGTSDTDITDATGSSYTLVAADEGNTTKVKVTFTDDADNDETLTSTATSSVAARPNSEAAGAPTISGTAQVGETLTADTSGITDSDGLTSVSYSYQWISNDGTSDTEITGATDSTYTLVAADEGKTIKVKVTFTDDADNDESLTSDATATVAARPNSPATGTFDIAGMAQLGETLTADTSGIADSDGLTSVSYSYQWISNDGTSDTEITGATDSTYTLVAADEGKTIKVRVSFTDDADNDEGLISTATDEVAAAPLPLTVSLANNPASHNGTDVFTFQIRFSEETRLSFRTLRDQAFTVTGGTVKKAKRQVKGSNMGWTITVEPDSNAAVEIVLPTTTDCATTGAICTGEGRKLSNRLEFRVSGPNQ